MGAGIIECDVTFTKDLELVCRHSQCDLHTTTNVVTISEMNAKCTTPFETGTEPKCCTSDFTLEELKTLCAKMDSSTGKDAATPEEYAFGGTPDWRTDLYQHSCHPILTHKESIDLIKSLGGKFTPELKEASVEMPFDGFTQSDYAQKMIDEYVEMGIPPEDVFPQSFHPEDVIYWVENTDYGDQAVALDENETRTDAEIDDWHSMLVEKGVKIVAPAQQMLVTTGDSESGIVPSYYAKSANEHGLDIISWTLERSKPGLTGDDVWYWSTLQGLESGLTDGDKFELLRVLDEEIGVIGVFSDWPATVSFYANCMDVGILDDGTGDAGTNDEMTAENGTGDQTAVATDGNADATDKVESANAGSAGGSRKLEVATRFVSLALRFVGI